MRGQVAAVVSMSLFLAACAKEDHGRVRVEPVLTPCYGFSPQACLLVTDLDDPAALTRTQGGISGFDHRWGTTFEVDYTIEYDDDPPADGSSVTWYADDVRVTATAPAGSPFTLAYFPDPAPWFYQSDGVVGTLGATVHCPDAITCDQALTFVDTAFIGAFTHDGQGALDLISVTPTP